MPVLNKGPYVIYAGKMQDGVPSIEFWEQFLEPGFADRTFNISVKLKIIRIVEGSCSWEIAGRNYTLGKGDIIVLSHAEPRAFTKIDGPSALHIEQLIFFPMLLYPFIGCLGFFFSRNDKFSHAISRTSPAYDEIYGIYEAISREARFPGRAYRDEFIQMSLMRLILSIADYYAGCGVLPGSRTKIGGLADYKMISDAVSYIHGHITDDLTEEALSRRFGCTRYSFSRKFRLYSGITFPDYICRIRIFNTVQLMCGGKINILDAAMECGFTSSSGFYKAFRKITNSSPKEYLKGLTI